LEKDPRDFLWKVGEECFLLENIAKEVLPGGMELLWFSKKKLVREQFSLKVLKWHGIVACSNWDWGDKSSIGRIEATDHIWDQIVFINRFAYNGKLVSQELGSLKVVRARLGALVKVLELTLEMGNLRLRLRGKFGGKVCPDLTRGIEAIDHGKNLLGESGINPTQNTLILLCPSGEGRVDSERHIPLIIKEKLRGAWFGTVDNSHEIMEA